MEAADAFFEDPSNEYVLQILFNGSRESNNAIIQKHLDKASDAGTADSLALKKQFFIQTVERGSNGTRLRGVGSAGDVEIMWVKGRKPLSHLKKKPRTHYGGSSASLMYSSVKKPSWKALTQVDGATKARIFSSPCIDTLNPSKWATDSAKKKHRIPKSARCVLPLNWWERDRKFFLEVFDNFNIGAVVDLFGSVNMATACLVSEPPRPYLALLRNPAHVDAFAKAIDEFIMREIGNAGPPPSKFFIEELKDVAARLYPNRDLEDEEDSSDDGGSGDD